MQTYQYFSPLYLRIKKHYCAAFLISIKCAVSSSLNLRLRVKYLDIFEMAVLVAVLNLEIAILSVDLGTRVSSPADRLFLTFVFALMHCVVSLLGFVLGSALNGLVGEVSRYISSAILIGVGYRIAKASSKQVGGNLSQTNILLILLGAGIEDLVGAFSVGVGTFGGSVSLMLLLFFVISVPVNLFAFWFGGKLGKRFGFSVDLVTGILLIVVGILSAFGVL